MARRTQAKRSRTPLIALIVAGVLGLGAVAYVMIVGSGGMATKPVEVDWNDDPQTLVTLARGATHGYPTAQVAIMEFADYSCPHCREFHESVKPRIDLLYLMGGQVKFMYHDLVTGSFPHSFLAARAARCAGDQEKYFEYHDVLFREQPIWSTSRRAPVEQLVAYAEELGLDTAAFEACLRSDKHADVVSANTELGVQLNLTRTPSVLIRAGPTSLPQPVDDPDVWAGIVTRLDSILAAGTPASAPPPASPAPAPPQP